MSDIHASERLMDLIFEAVDEAILPLKAGQELMPLLMLLTKGGYVLQRFTGETVTARLDKAYATIKTQDDDTQAYALVYDSVVTLNEKDFDAVMVEAGERGQKYGVRFVQRYQPKSKNLDFYTIGAVALIGEDEQYLPA